MAYHLRYAGIPSLAQQEPQTRYMSFFFFFAWNGEKLEEKLVKRIGFVFKTFFFIIYISHLSSCKKNQNPKHIL